MIGAGRAVAVAVVERAWHAGSYRGLHYGELLEALDRRIDRLARVKDPVKKLSEGVELLLGLYSFSEELGALCWSIRKVLELRVKVE